MRLFTKHLVIVLLIGLGMVPSFEHTMAQMVHSSPSPATCHHSQKRQAPWHPVSYVCCQTGDRSAVPPKTATVISYGFIGLLAADHADAVQVGRSLIPLLQRQAAASPPHSTPLRV